MKDCKGRKLEVGDYVLSRVTLSGRLVGRVLEFNDEFVVMSSIYPSQIGKYSFVGPNITRLEEDEALLFILKGKL